MKTRVNWGAIFAGAFIGISAMVFFSLFAVASGITGVNVIQPLTTTIGFGSAVYTVITSIISFALAGYCVTRLAGLRDPGTACLHSLVSFSVAGAMVPFLFTRTFLVGVPGFAITPPPGFFISLGLAWTIFLSYAFAAVATCAGGVQATYRRVGGLGEGEAYDEAARRRVA
jgi:hypothetical protein